MKVLSEFRELFFTAKAEASAVCVTHFDVPHYFSSWRIKGIGLIDGRKWIYEQYLTTNSSINFIKCHEEFHSFFILLEL